MKKEIIRKQRNRWRHKYGKSFKANTKIYFLVENKILLNIFLKLVEHILLDCPELEELKNLHYKASKIIETLKELNSLFLAWMIILSKCKKIRFHFI